MIIAHRVGTGGKVPDETRKSDFFFDKMQDFTYANVDDDGL